MICYNIMYFNIYKKLYYEKGLIYMYQKLSDVKNKIIIVLLFCINNIYILLNMIK